MLDIPSLKEPFLVGSTFKFLKAPLEFCNKLVRQDEGIVTCRIGSSRVVVILNPDYIKYVLQDNHTNYKRTGTHKIISNFLGNGLLTSEGEFWKRQRKLIQPAFHWDYLKQMSIIMREESINFMDRLRKNETVLQERPVLFSTELMNTTFQIVLRTLIGGEKSRSYDEVAGSLDKVMTFFYYYTQQWIKFPIWFPIPSHYRYRKAKKKLDKWIYEIISDQKEKLSSSGSLLSLLLNVRDEETGEGMSDQQIHDEILTLVMAGHETTANALNWTIWLLAENQDKQDKLRREIIDTWDKSQDIPSLEGPEYLKHVINESLRLYPPAWIFGRQAISGDNIDGYIVPPKSYIIISPYILQRHPKYWENPDEFIPDRFENSTKKYHKYAFIPFGAGPHFCIGHRFAMIEMQILLMVLLKHFRFIPSKNTVIPDPFGTLKPKGGLFIKIRPLS
ncbi:Cytochrome P450 [Hydrobacter penzbergensis]|uniref:Cytochrome P450 n=1 Tax=Hydrobacter penzbergensis TaxID=1235997 RepID=A0A8X8ICV1_9BACT|nr:cytochrome P450 [Hydrobacter penzbergensis]SDX00435.1 Cytochrome P450 [Hydrobacter penzbergensis]